MLAEATADEASGAGEAIATLGGTIPRRQRTKRASLMKL